jgi:lipopolysaccharide export system permease protein
MNILDRLIGRTILYSTLVVFAVLLGLFTFFEFVDKLGDLGQANFDLHEVTKYVLLGLPRTAYQLFPMAALLGTTVGLSSMALDSELVAMRAAGVSLLQIVGSVMKVGLIFVLSAMFVGEFIAPASENLAQRGRAEALHVGVQQGGDGIWLRDGGAFINIGEVLPDLSVLHVNIYEFDAARLLRHTYAGSGQFDEGYWQLRDVRETVLEGERVRASQRPSGTWRSVVDPSVLGVFAVKPEGLSAWNLSRYIRHLERNNQETKRYKLAFWYKVVAPLTTGVMVLLAVPFVFTQPRSAGMGLRLFLGIMGGLSFYVVNRGFGFFNVLQGLPPVFGAVLPTLLFLALALLMLRRVA